MAGQTSRPETVANQVFIGCPWHRVRSKYEHVIDELRNSSPIYFVVIGREDHQEARDLLGHILATLQSSSFAIFDATGGNPNVSLEYGVAEALDIPRALYLSTHAAATRSVKDAPIIADLAGKARNQYAQERGLRKLMSDLAKGHNYTKRFEAFLHKELRNARGGVKRSGRALALKIIHSLDGGGSRRRSDIVQGLLADPLNYREDGIDWMIRRLHSAGLIRSDPGRYSTVTIR